MCFETVRQLFSTIIVNVWYGNLTTSSPPEGQPRPRAFLIWAVLYPRIALALLWCNSNSYIDEQWGHALFQQSQWITAYAKGDATVAHTHMDQLLGHAHHLRRLYGSAHDYDTVTADMYVTWITVVSVLSADAASRDRPLYGDTTIDDLLTVSAETIPPVSTGTVLVWEWVLDHIDPRRLSIIRAQLPRRSRGSSIMELVFGGSFVPVCHPILIEFVLATLGYTRHDNVHAVVGQVAIDNVHKVVDEFMS